MIQFVKDIDVNKLRMAYNNDVLRFYNNSTAPAVWAEVALRTAGAQEDIFNVRLYPDPQGRFFINLKPYIAAIINTRNFEDKMETNLRRQAFSSFLYSFSQGTYLNKILHFTVMHADGSSANASYNLSWLTGVEQPDDYTRLALNQPVVLSPFKRDTANQHYLKYWQGYPFDMAFYTGSINFITLHNETNGLGQQLSGLSVVNRLFFSDGRTDETLESFLPLIEGFNKLRLGTGITRKDIVLEKIPYKCGVYLKWLNRYGGYSYWLFEDTYSIDRSTKQLGELERDNENVETTFGRTIQIGKESQDTMKIVAELLSEDERRIVEGIIDSPKIYLFTGRPLSRNSANDWVEVVLKTSGTRIKNPKQPLTNFTFDIELPLRYTQTL